MKVVQDLHLRKSRALQLCAINPSSLARAFWHLHATPLCSLTLRLAARMAPCDITDGGMAPSAPQVGYARAQLLDGYILTLLPSYLYLLSNQ